MHSQYLFDFVKAGFAPIRSKRIKVDGKTTLDQDELSKEFQEKLLEEISELAMDLSFIRVQLQHDHGAKVPAEPAAT